MTNYFGEKTKSIKNLKHFPYDTFDDFKSAINDKTVVDIAIPMDRAREWIMKSQDVPKKESTMISLTMLVLYLVPIFYLVMPFIFGNYWLLLLIFVSIIVLFTGSPMARRVFPFHWIFLGILGIMWVVGKKFPDFIYWLPILIQYKLLDFLYKGSANYSRSQILRKESALIWFWKWGEISLIYSGGSEYSQRFVKDTDGYHPYDDINSEWKEFIESRNK